MNLFSGDIQSVDLTYFACVPPHKVSRANKPNHSWLSTLLPRSVCRERTIHRIIEPRNNSLLGSLDEALEALATDEVVRSWSSSDLWDCYLSVKRNEIDLLERAEPGKRASDTRRSTGLLETLLGKPGRGPRPTPSRRTSPGL
jgi:hypothetical protein